MIVLPRITVVTPSFNQAKYLETTLRSVLDQGYPNLEYIVIDGGSTDGSVDIIRRYAARLSYWVSEKDQGQTHAINKGMSRATGELRAYLNSDDIYLAGALHRVAQAYRENPNADLFHGDCRIIDEEGRTLDRRRACITRFDEIVDVWNVWWKRRNFVQPEVFWTQRIAEAIGPFKTELFMVMDYEYWTRALRAGAQVVSIEEELAAFRRTATQKSNQSELAANEILQVLEQVLWDPSAPLHWRQRMNLQAKHLHQTRFLKQVRDAVERGVPRWRRLLESAVLALKCPKIFLVKEFRRRLFNVIPGSHRIQ